MTVNSLVDQFLHFSVIVTGFRKQLIPFRRSGPFTPPNLIDDLLEGFQLFSHIFSRLSYSRSTFDIAIDRLLNNISTSPTRLKRFSEATGIFDHLISDDSMFLTDFDHFLLEIIHFDSSVLYDRADLFPSIFTATHSISKNGIAAISGLLNKSSEHFTKLRETFLGLFKVTDDDFPRFSPTRLSRLLQSIPQLSESLDLGCSVFHGASLFDDFSGHLFGILTRGFHLLAVLLSTFDSEFLQCRIKDIRTNPAFFQRFSERTRLLDHCIDLDTHFTSSLFKTFLEDLTTHTGINNRVPVLQLNSACSKGLRKLIHCCRCLCTIRTGSSSQVRDTLNCSSSGI